FAKELLKGLGAFGHACFRRLPRVTVRVSRSWAGAKLGFERRPEPRLHGIVALQPFEAIDLLHSRWAGDVDFRQETADDVEPDEELAQIPHDGSYAGADRAIPIRQGALRRASPSVEVVAQLASGRNTQDCAQGLTIDQ